MKELAWKIAYEAFKNKVDRMGKPYMEHIINVESNIEDRSDEYLSCIAILHDLLEDCPEWTIEKLQQLFPSRIVEGIIALTNLELESYMWYIENQVAKNIDAIKVKIADLTHNMDIKRLKFITERDIVRLKKYHNAYKYLI